MKFKNAGDAGFTLVEVMIVVAIVAILATIGTPALLNAMPGMRASGAARQVLSDFRLARTLAVERGVDAGISFDAPSATHYFIYMDNDDDGTFSAGDETVKETTLTDEYKAVAFKSNDSSAPTDGVDLDGAGGNSISFEPRGSATGSGSVYLMPSGDVGLGSGAANYSDRNFRVRIISATGNTQLQTWDGSSWE